MRRVISSITVERADTLDQDIARRRARTTCRDLQDVAVSSVRELDNTIDDEMTIRRHKQRRADHVVGHGQRKIQNAAAAGHGTRVDGSLYGAAVICRPVRLS